VPTLTKERQKKDKEAVAAKGLTPGMTAINKGQTSITSNTTQGVLDKSTPLTPKDKTSSIKKAQVTGTTPQGQGGVQDKVMEEQNPRCNDGNEEGQEMGHTGSLLEGRNLYNTSFTSTNATPQDPVPSTILNNKCIVVSGWFGSPAIREGIEQLIQANGGRIKQSVSKKVDFILVGDRPGKNKILAGRRLGTHMVGLPSLYCFLDGESDWELFLQEPSPLINKFHEGHWVDSQVGGEDDGNLQDPPEVRQTEDKSNIVGTPEGTEETRNVRFNPITLQKKRTRDLAVVPDSEAPQDKMGSLVEGSILINRRGEPPCAIGHRNEAGERSLPKYTMVVQVYICCPSGNVKELIMELIFEGLATLHAEDKTVCFLHPLDFNQQARKRTDMPVKFQKIHGE
jgi:hypothetical protein